MGVKGDQATHLNRLFSPFNVRLKFVEAGKAAGVEPNSKHPTIVWYSFNSHKVGRFPNQVGTHGGLGDLTELIRKQAAIPSDIFYSKTSRTTESVRNEASR